MLFASICFGLCFLALPSAAELAVDIKLVDNDPRLAQFKAAGGKNGAVPALGGRALLDRRQYYCDPGYGYCAAAGGCCESSNNCCSYGYCILPEQACCPNGPCDAGESCCGYSHCYPEGGECCSNEGYCEAGNHCYIAYGRNVCCTDRRCTARVIGGTTSYFRGRDYTTSYSTRYDYSYRYEYYYFTFTLWYYSFYYTQQDYTSTRVYTTTTLKYYASNSADASAYSSSLSRDLSSRQERIRTIGGSVSLPTLNGGGGSSATSLNWGPTGTFGGPPDFGNFSGGGDETAAGDGGDVGAVFRPGLGHWVAMCGMVLFAVLSGTLMIVL